jgi:hypothetical protein
MLYWEQRLAPFFDPISFGTGTLIGAGVGAAFGGLAYGATQIPWKKVASGLTDTVDKIGGGIEDAAKSVAGKPLKVYFKKHI